jgi:hypothetical protein
VANRGVARIDARRVFSLEHLQRLLVDTDDDRVFRRMQIQPTPALGFRQKLRVFALEPLPDAMRPQVLEAQNAADLAGTDRVTGAFDQRLGQRLVCPDVAERCGGLHAVGPRARELHQLTPSRNRDPCGATGTRSILESLE